MKIHNIINESQIASEHVKGGLDSYYQLTKAKRLAKADGHDYDKLPEYDRGKDQPHKEKYMALAKEVKEGPDFDASDIHRGDAITCKQCNGKGCDHCDHKGVHPKQETTEDEYDDDYEKAIDFEPTAEAEAWYDSIVDHDDLDNMYNQWEEAFSQADTEDKVDVALHHVQVLLADGPLDDYNTLWQAWEQDEDIKDMLPKYQAMAKKSAGTPELPGMGEELNNLRKRAGLEVKEVIEVTEGEERSIIADACIEKLVDTFGESPGSFADNQEELIQKMYSDLEAMDVEDVVDPTMEVGGQPIGNFASGRVVDVIDPSDVIDNALQHVNLADLEEQVSETDDEVDTGPTWKDDLEDALDGYPEWAHEYIKDGVCPECGGNGYMDGDYEDEDGEENEECNGMYNYDCDEGEIRDNTWADELKSKEPEAPKQPAPSKEQIMKLLPMLHKEYVQSGRYNAFELGGILKQMYPELNKRLAGSYVADFFKTFEEDIDEVAGAKDCWDGYKKDGTQAGTGKNKGKRVNKCVKEENLDESSDEVMVAKMLAKALGDENRWTEMSAPELYAELESTSPDVADMIRNLAKMLYDVKLQERTYKDVGVADTVKDQRGKEFNFDKSSKKFKSQDGEEADVTTKLGKDLMRIRKNQMKKTTPSYKTKKNQGIMASIEEAYGDNHEITLEDNEDFNDVFGVLGYSLCEQDTFEAEYQGRKVKLNKPMQGDVKKFKVYVKDPKTGNTKKVNFGHGGSSVKGKAMKIRKSNPKARKSFRARHNCDNPGPKTKARYWSCRKW